MLNPLNYLSISLLDINYPHYLTKSPSPPIPLDVGSTTVSVLAVAIAASIALPPFFRISNPACAASACEVRTMPLYPYIDILFEGYGYEKGLLLNIFTLQYLIHL